MSSAARRLAAAHSALAIDPAGAVSAAYYAALYAARAALSERDRYAKTHSGTWHLFQHEFVAAGSFDEAVFKAAARLQSLREAGDYEATSFSTEDAEATIRDAERFIEAVRELFGA